MAVLGALCVAVALVLYLWATRCPCARNDKKEEKKEDEETPSRADEHNQHVSTFVCAWTDAAAAPSAATRLAFLLNTDPYHTYECNAGALFATDRRVRVTLPRGEYLVRATFDDEGRQTVAEGAWSGNAIVSLTASTLSCTGATTAEAVPAAPAGACL